jgi:hypothetical protein
MRPRGKVQVPNRCRPVDTGSVLFLSQVCPDEQLSPRRLRVNLGWKLKYETARDIASFPTALSAAITRWCARPSPRLQIAGRGSRITVAKPQITPGQTLVIRDAISNRLRAIRNFRNSNAVNAESLSIRLQNAYCADHFEPPPSANRCARIGRFISPNSRYNHAFLGAAGESNT